MPESLLSSLSYTAPSIAYSLALDRYLPQRGHVLRRRYRIVSDCSLPENQRRQGQAWLAIDMQLQQRILLREILIPERLALASSREQIAQFVAEQHGELAKHPGFQKMVELVYDKGSYFLALLFPQGESLSSWLQRQGGVAPEYLVVELGYQICNALAVLSSQQPVMVHGSLNPETIIIGTEGQFVSLIHMPLFPYDVLPANVEKVSAGYSAPEQVHGEAIPSSDLYGLAVLMHHVVTGYDPRARLAHFHPPARLLNPAITPQMEKILIRQISPAVSQRYADPREMQQDLAALLETYHDSTGEKNASSSLSISRLSTSELRAHSKDMLLLDTGVFAAICVIFMIIAILAIIRP